MPTPRNTILLSLRWTPTPTAPPSRHPRPTARMGVRWTFRELAENELNNFRFFAPHELNSLQLRHKQMSFGWIKGQRPFPHHPQGIRNGVTLVQTSLKRSTNSRVGNVSPYLSVFQDKFLAELAKEVCVVCAADHSNFRSVKGDSVTQALIFYKKTQNFAPRRCIRMENILRGVSVQYPEKHTSNFAPNQQRYSPNVSTWSP